MNVLKTIILLEALLIILIGCSSEESIKSIKLSTSQKIQAEIDKASIVATVKKPDLLKDQIKKIEFTLPSGELIFNTKIEVPFWVSLELVGSSDKNSTTIKCENVNRLIESIGSKIVLKNINFKNCNKIIALQSFSSFEAKNIKINNLSKPEVNEGIISLEGSGQVNLVNVKVEGPMSSLIKGKALGNIYVNNLVVTGADSQIESHLISIEEKPVVKLITGSRNTQIRSASVKNNERTIKFSGTTRISSVITNKSLLNFKNSTNIIFEDDFILEKNTINHSELVNLNKSKLLLKGNANIGNNIIKSSIDHFFTGATIRASERSEVILSDDSKISYNVADGCGGLYLYNSDFTMLGQSKVTGNIGNWSSEKEKGNRDHRLGAGGICAFRGSTIALNDQAQISNNRCAGQNCVGGVSLYYADLVVTSSEVIISENEGDLVGGIFSRGMIVSSSKPGVKGRLNFKESFSINNNKANNVGGLLKIEGPFIAPKGLIITGNEGREVGGMHLRNVDPNEISSSSDISNNRAEEGAGGLLFYIEHSLLKKEDYSDKIVSIKVNNNLEKNNKQTVIEVKSF